MKALLRLLLCAAMYWGVAAPTVADDGSCHGAFPNPITDICWSCIFPIKIGSTTLYDGGQEDNESTTDWTCKCGNFPDIRYGLTVSFWEPVRIAETVRNPYCFPSLGGLTMDMGVDANRHAPTPEKSAKKKLRPGQAVLFHEHWYVNPLVFYLEAVLETRCLEQNVFDIAYVTELDPLWVDVQAAFILSPEAVLFANPLSIAACAEDCIAATAGFPNDLAFWCAGCQSSMYPLVGWVQQDAGPLENSALLLQRLTNKLHREGLMWGASGEDGYCGFYVQPVMQKTNYKYSMIWPVRQTDKDLQGRCCQPFGRSTVDWGIGRTIPVTGENYSYQVFRKRDCCQGAW